MVLVLLGALAVGMLFGPVLAPVLVGALPRSFASSIAKSAIRGWLRVGDEWLLIEQSDGNYRLESVVHEDGLKMTNPDEEAETDAWTDPHGHMGSLLGKKFGVAYEEIDGVLRPSVARLAEAEGAKSDGQHAADSPGTEIHGQAATDGGQTTGVGQIVGYGENGSPYVNPFAAVEDGRRLVDLSAMTHTLKKASDPQTYSRAVAEAIKSQEVRQDRSQLQANLERATFLILGGVLVYMGGGSGGGGGGSVVPLHVGLAPLGLG